MTSINIVIHYANDPAFNSRVRDLVEQIFATCFETLQNDQVFFTWVAGTVPDKDTGRKQSLTEWHINLNNKLKANGVNGQSAGYESNINVSSVQSDAANVTGGDADAAMANTIAHEIGVHVIADYDWTHPTPDSVLDVANESTTRELARHIGYFSSIVCSNMRIELARLTWLS
ncbi:2-polyprenyl-6-methoxyphenol hydroxylase and related FAD-dependent oxidoreductases [Candidatus Scalindua japonica]|uniref:2-polyprenyl-6-methoxyphenol hydroxylase and related FAD-dependent oxidoreductases n=1 Tax=Candidatus Scalindua japonica TaxID=1284222 RepID=A0A286TUC1_9BACT|nr:hypothetical protein [Candidatus Scalindua japonica]GAX59445.1 2-polyprenyl-6-methoxyphenol hydroxylase and related FAD-dependent oxidoreductases [Candidatus Scalindua japonica]